MVGCVIPAMFYHPKITDYAGPSKKQDPISKITRAKRPTGVVQVVEHLPSYCKVKSSSPSTNPPPKKTFIVGTLFKKNFISIYCKVEGGIQCDISI
jgi:hypothetical protein